MFEQLDRILEAESAGEITTPVHATLREGERRIVAILFADLAGFTVFAEKHDSEQVQGVLDRLFKLFTRAVEQHGGHVDKYEGDLVMALFGARKASDRDTEHAIRAGIELIEITRRFNAALRRVPELETIELGLRVGINTGLVTTGKIGAAREGDFTVYGDAVNVASRLEGLAPVNSVVVSEASLLLARSAVIAEACGEAALKGKSEPLRIFRITGVREARAGLELWRSNYVGRDAEFHALEGAWANAKSGEGDFEKIQVVGIKGSPGMGKSRLVHEFIARIPVEESRRALCFGWGFTPSANAMPWATFTSLLRNLAGIDPVDSADVMRDKFDRTIARLETTADAEARTELQKSRPFLEALLGLRELPEPSTGPGNPAQGAEQRTRVQTAIRAFVEAAARAANREGEPFALILEDIHWMDGASASTISFLFETLNLERRRRNIDPVRILFLLLYRPEFDAGILNTPKIEFRELILQSLTLSDTRELIRSMTGDREIPESTLDRLEEKSAGNPFFVEEWVAYVHRQWEDTGAENPFRLGDSTIPDSLNSLILSRIDQLDDELKLLLQKAAAIGRTFAIGVLENVERKFRDIEQISGELTRLAEQDFIHAAATEEEESGYIFKHVLTQEVAYGALLLQNRKTIHRIIGEVIEERLGARAVTVASDLARHFAMAEDHEKAVLYFLQAGDAAWGAWDFGSAEHSYRAALELAAKTANPNSLRCELLIRLAQVLCRLGRVEEAKSAVEESSGLFDIVINPKQRAGGLSIFGYAWTAAREFDRARRYFADLRQHARAHNFPEWEADALAGHLHLLWESNSWGEAVQVATELVAISENLEDRERFAWAMTSLGTCFRAVIENEKALEWHRRALALAEELGLMHCQAVCLNGISEVLSNLFRDAETLEFALRALELNEKIGERVSIMWSHWAVGRGYMRCDNEKAIEHYEKALALARTSHDLNAQQNFLYDLGKCLDHVGRYDELDRNADEGLEIANAINDELYCGVFLVAKGHARRGRFEPGRDLESAIACYDRAIKIFEGIDNTPWADIHRKIAFGAKARVHEHRNEFDKALEIQKEVVAHERATAAAKNEPHYLALSLAHFGNTHWKAGNHESADAAHREALELASAAKSPDLMTTITNTIGKIRPLDGLAAT